MIDPWRIDLPVSNLVANLVHQMSALSPGPRPQPEKSAVQITQRSEPLKDWIDPAIEWNIRRPLICWRQISVAAEYLADRSPRLAAEIWIVMAAVDVLCDDIADHAAGEHVRGKMLPGAHARKVDRGRQTIDEQLGEESGVFMRNDSRHRPSGSGVFRREGCTAAEKVPAPIPLKRPLTSQRILQSFNHHQTVQGCFTGKKSSLSPVIVVRGVAQQPHPRRASDSRSPACV